MSGYRIQYVLLTVTEPEEDISCRECVCNSSESIFVPMLYISAVPSGLRWPYRILWLVGCK